MPRINRFRIVNFKFDDNKKQIADELFDLGGESTLLNLENGGGKTVILQLSLQVLKPNTTLGSRRFSDYFKLDSGAAHIMAEWILEGLTKEYLLTGVCFSKGTDGLRYFTYTYNYSAPNEYDIKNIPVVDNKKQVAGYSGFNKFLRELASSPKYRINIYTRDRQKDYRQKLESYNLFEDEFNAVRIINQTEGGLEKFFENAKKSRHVIEKLIIPSMPSLDRVDINILAETFKKHMENLKNIPLYQHRIKIYDSFLEKFKDVLRNVQDYAKEVENNFVCYRELCILENLFYKLVKRVEGDIERTEESIEKTKSQIKEAKYRKDSLQYWEKAEQIKMEEIKLEQLGNNLKLLEDEKNELDYLIRYRNSINSYIDLNNYRSKLIEQETRLKSTTKEQGELEDEYQNCLFYLNNLLQEKKTRLNEEYNELVLKEENIEKEISERTFSLSEIEKERDDVIGAKAVLEDRIKESQKEIKRLTQYFWSKDTAIIFEPAESIQKLENQKEALVKEKDYILKEKDKLVHNLEDNKVKETNIRESLAGLKVGVKGIEEDILDYNNRLNQLVDRSSVYEVSGDPYSDTFSDKLKHQMATLSSRLTDEINRFHDMQKKKLLLEDCDYYIPDYEIKKVYEFLKENDINCLPGALWLRYQHNDNKEELLRLNPLIQYSIVLEESEMNRIIALQGKISELVLEYPVVLIVNSSKGISMSKVENTGVNKDFGKGINPIDLLDIYVVHGASSNLAVDQEAFKEYVEKIDINLQEISSGIERHRLDEKRLNKLIVSIEEFRTNYPKLHINELNERLKQKNNQVEHCNMELSKLAEQRKGIEENRIMLEKNIVDIDTKEEENKLDIKKLTDFIDLNSKEKTDRTKLEDCEKQQKIIEKNSKELKSKLELLESQLIGVREKWKNNRNEKEQNGLRIEETNTLLKIKEISMEIKGSIKDIESRVKGLESKINIEQIGQLIEYINNIKKNIKDAINNMEKQGFEEKDMEGISQKITEEEIREDERRLKNTETKIGALKKEERNVSGKKERLIGIAQNMKENIEKSYRNLPFEFDGVSIIDITMYDKQIKTIMGRQEKNEERLLLLQNRRGYIREICASLEVVITTGKMGEEEREKIDFRDWDNLLDGTSIWDVIKMSEEELAVMKNNKCREYRSSIDSVKKSEDIVKEAYEGLYSDKEWEGNEVVKGILSGLIKENIYNYEYIDKIFNEVCLTIENMKEGTQLQLRESLENKNEIVERSYRRAETIYKELKMVDRFSRIKIGGLSVKTVEIQMPPLQSETGKIRMSQYIDNCINEIEAMKANMTYDPAKIDEEISKMMSSVRILDAIADLNEVVIKVYKPQSNVELSGYIPWEVVTDWSGGEKLAGFFAMFISIISYLRYKKTSWHGSSKVIWIDNPFGQANAVHLLSYIFELAKATKTQMICLTGLQEVNIYAQFDVVYSLVHRMLMSKTSVLKSNLVKSNQELETALYKVAHEQMSFID